jgi:CRP/FNR family transcriptional regulator
VIKDDRESAWAELIGAYPVFLQVEPAAMASWRRSPHILDIPAGAVVFREQQPCTGFPLLLRGGIRVAKIGENGREIALYRVHSGGACIVSTSCLLGERPYSAFGVTEAPTRLALIPRETFQQLLQVTRFREFVFALFADRIVSLMAMVESLAFHRLDQRLAVRLIEQAPEWRISQQALAADLGSVREIIGRILNGFAQRGLVELHRGRIRIRDLDGLAHVARAGADQTEPDVADRRGA